MDDVPLSFGVHNTFAEALAEDGADGSGRRMLRRVHTDGDKPAVPQHGVGSECPGQAPGTIAPTADGSSPRGDGSQAKLALQRYLGRKVGAAPGDGSCFYHAVRAASGEARGVEALRRLAGNPSGWAEERHIRRLSGALALRFRFVVREAGGGSDAERPHDPSCDFESGCPDARTVDLVL